ncbi:coiled-coil domain-containing protein 157-like [Stigmatopora nigra]
MQFLGRQDCIESLHRDLTDLQGVTVDVFSTTGPMQIFSWKFPDKLSGNLDLDLKQYSFMHGDEEFNQHAHIVLLELVIDRLLLLLQASNVYFEQHSPIRNQPADQKEYTSIGLVVKKYWSHLLQFSNMKICNEPNIQAEISSCNKNVGEDTPPFSGSPYPPFYPDIDTFNISCQTEESLLTPCSTCQESQSFMRKSGNILVELLHGEGLPSSLHSVLVAEQDGVEPTTPIDVSLWASEHLQDLQRLTKHVQDVRGTVEQVTMKLEASERRGDKLEIDIESVRKEVEKQKSIIVELEKALQKAQASMKETEQKLSNEYRLLKTEYGSLKKNYSDLSEEGAIQQKRLQDLENQRNTLQKKLDTQHIQEEAYSKLQERMQQFASQLGEADLLLEREKAKCNSARRHLESMDSKQNSLRQRLEALDEECEQLQKRLEESEERELKLTNQVQRMSKENEELQTQLSSQQDICSHLESEKQTLQTQIDDFQSNMAELQQSLETFKETERLLVAFPELSPLAHARPKSKPISTISLVIIAFA